MQVTPMGRRCSFKRQNSADDDIAKEVKHIKKQDPESSIENAIIQPNELWHSLQKHMSSPLPECESVFPWLHGYSNSAPPEYPDSISIVRSQPMQDGWIQNSGVLKCSMDPHEFLISWASLGDIRLAEDKSVIREVILKELSRRQISVGVQDLDDVISLCCEYGALPFLNTDGRARDTYSITRRVGNNHRRSSVFATAWKQPGSFRRFDIQPAKMLEMSSHIIIYCLHDKEAHSDKKVHCSRCFKLRTVLNLALKFIRANYVDGRIKKPRISILQYQSLEDIPLSLMGTPPMKMDSLNKSSPIQLVSPFDLVSFNNWDRDLLYREKLEVSKMSSATPVENSLSCWCGNSTDYQVYKLLIQDSKGLNSFTKDRLAYPTQNSIVTIPRLQCNINDPTAVDSMLFNIPSTPKPWIFMIRCLEKASLPSLKEIMDSLSILINNPNPPAVELNFPSSGTITLGSLNINSIQIILNLCFVLYQIGNLTNYGTLIYCSDGYTETTFLLVAYLIFLWDLSLEETLLKLHLEYQRPFFLFPVDLEVLGHLQSLLREFSPKRLENYRYYRVQRKMVFEPLNITPEMFSKVFLFRVPPESDFSALKGPLPSRILPHLYLGSLEHAQSPGLLKKMGINYIVSVGENLSWAGPMNSRQRASSLPMPSRREVSSSPIISPRIRSIAVADDCKNVANELNENFRSVDIYEQEGFKILRVTNLGDNGKDSLTSQLEHILTFIDECYKKNGKVLVHCMVGVSRSATVCIAECMKRLNCSVLRAYLFVRVRRLNIIIQPNLMFMYELLKWQENQGRERVIDWPIICRSISELNNNYI